MKTFFLLLLTVLMTSCMNGQEVTGLSPEDLKVVIYPGNNEFAIVHVSLAKNDRDFGYNYVGVATSGKPSKNRWTTRLLIDTRKDSKETLNFAMTIPSRAIKESDKFFLQSRSFYGIINQNPKGVEQ